MKKILITILALIMFPMVADAKFWGKKATPQPQNNTQNQSQSNNQNSEVTYPDDLDSEPIIQGEYVETIDIEQMYRDMPVPEFRYVHNADPGEYQDIKNSTWSPYPLFRLVAPLYFKSIAIEPGYYLLTPREHEGKWYILFKEAGKVKYIVPCYKKEMVPMDFYKNNLPQIKMSTFQLIREKTLNFVGKHFNSSKREPTPNTYLDASDLDNNFISVIVYWGNYRYYMVLRSIQL